VTKKKLLAAGCSYTDKNFYSADKSIDECDKGGWPMWPELMAKELDLDCVNLGKVGASNKYIFDTVFDHIYSNNDIGLVVVMWSGWDRFEYMELKQQFPTSALIIENINEYKKYKEILNPPGDTPNKVYDDFFKSLSKKDMVKYSRTIVNTNLRYMYILSDLLNKMKIPFIFFQGIVPFPINITTEIDGVVAHTDADIAKDLNLCVFHNALRKDKRLVGFPFFKMLNGIRLADLTKPHPDLCVSDVDTHPNAKGQKVIANFMKDSYDRIYSI
tara:strand:+ start:1911 stop:2726 length:816 start_codon:yes stop_codon:yes gene_type:complete